MKTLFTVLFAIINVLAILCLYYINADGGIFFLCGAISVCINFLAFAIIEEKRKEESW